MLKGNNYCITPKNLLCHEMIGLYAKVNSSTDKNKEKISGTIIDETKNLFVIRTKNENKKIPKKEAEFEFSLGDEKVLVQGKKICVRPFDRTKQFWRKSL